MSNVGIYYSGLSGQGDSTVNAVRFGISNEYLSAGQMSGVSDSKLFTASFWLNIQSLGSSMQVIDFGESGVRSNISFALTASGDPAFTLNASTTGSALNAVVASISTTLSAGQWQHILMSFDTSDTGKRHIYIDDVADSTIYSAYSNRTMPYTNLPDSTIGSFIGGTGKYNGDVAEFWMDYSYLDLSVESNRRKFISVEGKPVSLGNSGDIPTGTSPVVFLSGQTSTWHTNDGTGGGFTENGTLTTSTKLPVAI